MWGEVLKCVYMGSVKVGLCDGTVLSWAYVGGQL